MPLRIFLYGEYTIVCSPYLLVVIGLFYVLNKKKVK